MIGPDNVVDYIHSDVARDLHIKLTKYGTIYYNPNHVTIKEVESGENLLTPLVENPRVLVQYAGPTQH